MDGVSHKVYMMEKNREWDRLTRPIRNECISLRDYFAGQALAGLTTSQDKNGTWSYGGSENVATEAYKIADAMIQARGGE